MEVFADRPVGDVWGIGKVAQGKLHTMGIDTIGQFVAADTTDVRGALGSVGVEVQRMAAGDDPRPVAPRAPAKQVSAERTLQVDARTTTEAMRVLHETALAMHRRLLKDGRAARTVTVKTRTTDFQLHTKSAGLPAPTEDFDKIFALAQRLMPRPEEAGAFRLVGVSVSGLVADRQELLFPELDGPPVPIAAATETDAGFSSFVDDATTARPVWHATQDVSHVEFGHGWVQGAGNGVVSVRFETAATGPGKTRTFRIDDEDLSPANPLDSLAWDLDGLAED